MDKRVYYIIPQVIWIEMSKLTLPSWLNIFIKCEVNLAVNASRSIVIVRYRHVFPSVQSGFCMADCGFVSLWASEHSSTVQSQRLEQRRSPERLEFSLRLVSPSDENLLLTFGVVQCCVA